MIKYLLLNLHQVPKNSRQSFLDQLFEFSKSLNKTCLSEVLSKFIETLHDQKEDKELVLMYTRKLVALLPLSVEEKNTQLKIILKSAEATIMMKKRRV